MSPIVKYIYSIYIALEGLWHPSIAIATVPAVETALPVEAFIHSFNFDLIMISM